MKDVEQLTAENAALRERLEEAEALIDAIRTGAVDGFVVDGKEGQQVYTLESADKPYRVMVHSMQQGALTLRADGLILFCNPCFAALMLLPRERVVGTFLRDCLRADEHALWASLLTQGREAPALAELHLARSDGTVVAVEITLSALPLAGAAVLCALVTDLTRQRHYEALQQAERSLKEADRRKDEFLAMLAHELRNPLAPIRNSVTLLRHRPGQEPSVVRVLDMIDRQVTHLVRLVDDLLDVSRISRGKLGLRVERLDLAQVIQQAVEMSRPLIEARGHELELRVPPEPISLQGDLARLTQVVCNLIQNAAKYTDIGGHIRLWVERDRAAGRVLIRVRDNGQGIEEGSLRRLFDLFYQVDHSIDRPNGGLGIGLSLARSLVELHGGTLEAQSPGLRKGSEFTVRLPCLAMSALAQPCESA